nr:MAG TPA: hypothetical protein [Caudoviricetes sp.]
MLTVASLETTGENHVHVSNCLQEDWRVKIASSFRGLKFLTTHSLTPNIAGTKRPSGFWALSSVAELGAACLLGKI